MDGVDDMVVFEKFCVECLTVKPRPVSSCRIGKPTEYRPHKLSITLESSQFVDDLTESSSILRSSQINAVKRVYFNRDQTTIERQSAFVLQTTLECCFKCWWLNFIEDNCLASVAIALDRSGSHSTLAASTLNSPNLKFL